MQDSVLSLIGNTPVIEVKCFDTGLCRLFLKLESQNPGGSIKDRVALAMIEAAEREGKLRPGISIVEATAGNTGIALALVAAVKGYRLILVVPDKMSREKISHLKALGAEVVLARSDVMKGHAEYYQDKAQKLATELGDAFYVNQFGNPANPHAHETTTAPEIWSQMKGQVDAIVCGVGSSGTVTGLSRFFARVKPELELVLADPDGSILAHYVRTKEVLTESGSWLVEGIGEDFIPPVSDLSRVSKAYSISDRESFETARTLLRKAGILAGSSSGTLIAAAIRYCREQTAPKRVLTFVCDTGNKYLSKMYDDRWMAELGYLERRRHGDLRDLIARPGDEHEVISVAPDDTLLTCISRLRMYEISQVPVIEDSKIIGIIDELDIATAVRRNKHDLHTLARDVMTTKLVKLSSKEPIDALEPIFAQGMVAIVEHEGQFAGLITRMDLLIYLRRNIK